MLNLCSTIKYNKYVIYLVILLPQLTPENCIVFPFLREKYLNQNAL